MANLLSDEELNVGKILILSMGHKLKISEIKKITLAKKVKRIKWTGEEDIDSFVWHNIFEGFRFSKEEYNPNIDMYYVQGDEATTIFLRLKNDGVIASLEWSAMKLK